MDMILMEISCGLSYHAQLGVVVASEEVVVKAVLVEVVDEDVVEGLLFPVVMVFGFWLRIFLLLEVGKI